MEGFQHTVAGVVIDQGRRGFLVRLEAAAHAFGLVILTLDEGLARDIIQSMLLGWVVRVGVGPSRRRMDPAVHCDAMDGMRKGNERKGDDGIVAVQLGERGSCKAGAQNPKRSVVTMVTPVTKRPKHQQQQQ